MSSTIRTMMAVLSCMVIVVVMAFGAGASDTILACKQGNGSILYTNKDVKGCAVVALPTLSVVPTPQVTAERVTPEIIQAPLAQHDSHIITASPMVCELYHDWIQLQSRTSGGFQHNSIEDTQKRLTYTTIFGSGYPPTGC